jgi:hypothetical protein
MDGEIDLSGLQKFKVLALPNVTNISDLQCTQLKAFVEGGGVTFWQLTAIFHEQSIARQD